MRKTSVAIALVLLAAGLVAGAYAGKKPCPGNSCHGQTTATSPATTTTPSTTTSPTTNPDPSGQPAPSGDLPGWRQLTVDKFAGESVPLESFVGWPSTDAGGRWSAYPYGWHDTSGNGAYWPEKGLSIHDGLLDMWIHTENGVHVVENPFMVLPGKQPFVGQLYGRYTVRFKIDPVPGYKTAWLLWPDSGNWPNDGEIDFPEGNLDSTICGFMHRQGGTSGSDQDAYCTATPEAGQWHTATIEWLSSRVTFLLDGQTVGQSTARIPSTPMHWVLQTETQLCCAPPADSAQGHVMVDWAAIYAPA